MAYIPLNSKSDGDAVTAADWNKIGANFENGVPGEFTTKGDIFVASGSKAGGRLGVGAPGSALVADTAQTFGMSWKSGRFTAGSVIDTGSLGDGVTTTIQGGAETFDPDGVLVVAGDWSYTARATGVYLVGALLHVSGFFSLVTVNKNMLTAIFKVGADTKSILSGQFLQGAVGNRAVTNSAVDIIQMTAGDVLKVYVYTENDSPMTSGLDNSSVGFAHFLGV